MSWLLQLHDAGLPMLTLAWAVPLLLAMVVNWLPGRNLPLLASLGSTLAVLGVSVEALDLVALREQHGWMLEDRLALGPWTYHVGLDGLGAMFLTLVNLVALLVGLYAWVAGKTRPHRWYAWLFVLQASLAGMIVSLDLVLFAVFALLEILPARAMVSGWGDGDPQGKAAGLVTRFLGLSVALWLAGAAVLAVTSGAGTDLIALRAASVPAPWADVAFFLMLYALAVRLPMFPFHGWLPPVVEHGPLVGLSVFLLGVKVGAFGLVRFVLPLFPAQAVTWSWLVTLLGFVGLVYGALVAMVQDDLRKILAYAALSHMGFVVPGLFSLNEHGVTGALLETLNLGIVSAGLFFVVGFLFLRTGTTRVDEMRGIAGSVPWLTAAFLVLALASIGMPATSGWEGVHLLLEGAIESERYAAAVAAGLGTVLSAVALFVAYLKLLVDSDEEETPIRDLGARELAIAGAVCALVVALGLYTEPWQQAVELPARSIAAQIEAVRTTAAAAELEAAAVKAEVFP
jgi:NADH-quinone oxidoreductase subunit M